MQRQCTPHPTSGPWIPYSPLSLPYDSGTLSLPHWTLTSRIFVGKLCKKHYPIFNIWCSLHLMRQCTELLYSHGTESSSLTDFISTLSNNKYSVPCCYQLPTLPSEKCILRSRRSCEPKRAREAPIWDKNAVMEETDTWKPGHVHIHNGLMAFLDIGK